MKNLFICCGLLLFCLSCKQQKKEAPQEQEIVARTEKTSRYVEGNRLISPALPEIEIEVADEFKYVGTFYFELKANSENTPAALKGKVHAVGDRYVFAKADTNKKVEKLFIVQCEGFLPHIENHYRYNFSEAETLGNNKYRHNTWFYDSARLARDHPEDEGALTRAFLEEQGYALEEHFMMSRWVGLASEDKKHEILIYYLEMLKSTTGHTLQEYEQLDKVVAEEIRTALIERSRKSFKIVKG